MDITGARWGLEGAERYSSYERYGATATGTSTGDRIRHGERERVHEARYAGNVIPLAA